MMAGYGMTIKEVEELTLTQFLLFSVELAEILKQQAGGDAGSGISGIGIGKDPFIEARDM